MVAEERRAKSKSSGAGDGKLRDSDLISWLVGFLFFAIIIGGVFRALQGTLGSFGDSGFGIGAIVSADGEIEVLDAPAIGTLLGTQEHGAEGKITDGPALVDRNTWWYVDFAELPDGWVDEDDLTVEVAALGVGDRIEMVRLASVWDQIGGGTIGGLQGEGSLGTIQGGPGIFGGERWWNVDFDSGPDGWVRDADVRRAPGFLVLLWRRVLDKILLPSLILSVLLLATVVALSLRTGKLALALKEKYQTPETTAFVRSKAERTKSDERWGRIQELVNAPEPGNWRLAILEADVILADIVGRMGYDGETLGERLKQVEKSDFATLDSAWEAHKVRNTIAHEGGDFILTQREARRVIDLYESVFEEFHYL